MADQKKSNSNHPTGRAGASGRPTKKAEPHEPFSFRYFLKALGPGLITGASDDDPSGIGTYSQAGAQLGYGIGWTMLLSFPLMAASREISARVGRVTGHGISGNVCRHYSPSLLNLVVALLLIANTSNIAADLGAMADATKLLIGGPVNGVLAVPVMVLLMFMARQPNVMGKFVIRGPLYWLGWLSTAAMFLSVLAMGVGMFL